MNRINMALGSNPASVSSSGSPPEVSDITLNVAKKYCVYKAMLTRN